MEKIKIAITGRVASVVALPEVVADNAEYEVDFALDPREGWDTALPITALFVRRDGSYTARILDAGETSCTMPPQTGTNIVFAGLTQDDMRTTTPATIKVHRSIRTVAHDPLPAPSEDVYAQILAAYAGIKVLSGKGAPTSATQGRLNQLYRDEDTQRLYICTATDGGYTWAAVSGGSVDVDATLTKAGYAADAKAAGDAIGKKIDAPQTAAVGEVLTVEKVDADGKPTKWKTAPAAAGIDVVAEITAESTNEQIPSAKAVYTGITDAQKVKLVKFTFVEVADEIQGGIYYRYSADTSLSDILQGLQQGIKYYGIAEFPPESKHFNIYEVQHYEIPKTIYMQSSVIFAAINSDYSSTIEYSSHSGNLGDIDILGENIPKSPVDIHVTRENEGSNILSIQNGYDCAYIVNLMGITTVQLDFENNIYTYSWHADKYYQEVKFSAIIESDNGLKYSVITINDNGSITLHETKIQ